MILNRWGRVIKLLWLNSRRETLLDYACADVMRMGNGAA